MVVVGVVVFYCSDDLLGCVVVCAVNDAFYHVHHFCGRASAFVVVFDDAFAFNQQNAEGYYNGCVWYRVPREGKAEDVNQRAEDYDAQVVQNLCDGPAKNPAFDFFLVLPGCI